MLPVLAARSCCPFLLPVLAARFCCLFLLPIVKHHQRTKTTHPKQHASSHAFFVSFLLVPVLFDFSPSLLSWFLHFFTRIKILPTKEEIEMCTSYDGETTSLGKVEQFFVHLAKVPHCKLRAEAMLAKNNLVDQTDEVRLRLNYHEKASKQVRGSLKEQEGIFRTFLQMVLKVGNYVNGGTRRGGAYGIKLDSISKMASVKTSNNKSNLLRYCAVELERLHGAHVVGSLRKELDGIEDASKAPLDEIKSGIVKITKGIQLMTSCVEKSLSSSSKEDSDDRGDNGDNGEEEMTAASAENEKNAKFVEQCFTTFLTYAEGVRDGLSNRHRSVEEEGDRIVQLFAEDSKKTSSADIYVKLHAIVKLFEKSSAANKRDMERVEKAEKRAEKMLSKEAAKAAKSQGGGGVFEAHDLFQSGGANDIVARVRQRNMDRKTTRNDNFDDEDEENNTSRPPPPPKPPPKLANLGL